jgi:hypothetical protein
VRRQLSESDALLHALVDRLSGVPGLNLKVDYRRGRWRRLVGDLPYVNDLHKKSYPIGSIRVGVGTTAYWVRATHGSLSCGSDNLSVDHGMVTEEQSVPAWTRGLLATLEAQCHLDPVSLSALRDLTDVYQT